MRSLTAVVHREDNPWVALCPEVGTSSQGYNIDEAVANGFVQVRQRGSHVVLRKKGARGDFGCVVPLHRDVAVGSPHNILRLAQLTEEEFVENL